MATAMGPSRAVNHGGKVLDPHRKGRPGVELRFKGGGSVPISALEPDAFKGDFSSFLRAADETLSKEGQLVLLTEGMNRYGPPPHSPRLGGPLGDAADAPGFYPWSLVDTLMDCAMISLDGLLATVDPPVTGTMLFVLGRKPSMRQLWLYAESLGHRPPTLIESNDLPPSPLVFWEILSSRPEAGAKAWRQSHPDDWFLAERHAFVHGIGERMGDFHDRWIIDADAHEDNFILGYQVEEDGIRARPHVQRVDLRHSGILYRPLTTIQSAFTFLPLLSTFSREDWRWFREGYIQARGPAAIPIVDLVEYGDMIGWMLACREGELRRASALLHEQLATYEHSSTLRAELEGRLATLSDDAEPRCV